jgi:cell division protein FtsB
LTFHGAVYGLVLIIIFLTAYTVAGDRGALHLWRLRSEKAKLDEQNFRLQKENETLRQRITLVRSNNFYLEKLAREELNLVRPGEVIYRFPSPRSEDRRVAPTEPKTAARPESPGSQR